MWVKYRGHLLNFTHICGISAGHTKSISKENYNVRIYASGKCFEMFSFLTEEERDICFDELEQICEKQNQGTQLCFEF